MTCELKGFGSLKSRSRKRSRGLNSRACAKVCVCCAKLVWVDVSEGYRRGSLLPRNCNLEGCPG